MSAVPGLLRPYTNRAFGKRDAPVTSQWKLSVSNTSYPQPTCAGCPVSGPGQAHAGARGGWWFSASSLLQMRLLSRRVVRSARVYGGSGEAVPTSIAIRSSRTIFPVPILRTGCNLYISFAAASAADELTFFLISFFLYSVPLTHFTFPFFLLPVSPFSYLAKTAP